jgi:opacity protein-like surface antigen
MKNKYTWVKVTVFGLLMQASICFALPIGTADAGKEYLIATPDLHNFSGGVYYHKAERKVDAGRLTDELFTYRSLMGYIGYDILRWVTIYGTLGQNKSRFDSLPYSSGDSEYGFGVAINLLNYEMMDPTLHHHFLFDRIRINAGGQYTRTSGSWLYYPYNAKWQEVYAWLTLSIINDISGNKLYTPLSIAITAGPTFSDIQGENIDEKDALGVMGAIEIYFSKTLSVDVSIEKFEKEQISGGIHIRF